MTEPLNGPLTGDLALDSLAGIPGLGASDDASSIAAAVSPRRLAWRRFRRHRIAVVALVFLIVIALAAVIVPPLLHHQPGDVDIRALRSSPGGGHLLGTDSSGRDVLSWLAAGGRVSLLIGLVVAAASTTIGLALGSVAGYAGAAADSIISRFADVVLSFPTLVVVIMIVSFSGPGLFTLIAALGLFSWPSAFRVVRSLTLALRQDEAVLAAIVLGARRRYILVHYVVPSVVGPLTVIATLLVAQSIVLESALSYLGLGVPLATPSWGNMLREARSIDVIESAWWVWIPPGLLVSLTVLAVNFVGDGLRDALDTRLVK